MSTQNQPTLPLDVYSIANDRIIALLEQGTIPWQKPWREAGLPMNVVSKRPYRGINVWLLSMLDYEQNLFLTWDQLKKLGGSVKQGEHGHVVVFWKTAKKNQSLEEAEGDGKNQKNHSILRYYKVFNVAQCKDIPEEMVPVIVEREHNPILECETIIKQMPGCPPIKHKEQKAFYNIEEDYINMPKKKSFVSTESYYSTLFHELVHSTGHEKRLNRKTITEMAEFGSDSYSMEELIAELGSSYLCNCTGIIASEIKNSAAYIAGWLKQLSNDKKFVVFAATKAQKAVDYIRKIHEPESRGELEHLEGLSS